MVRQITVAALSKAHVIMDSSNSGTADSNPVGSMNACPHFPAFCCPYARTSLWRRRQYGPPKRWYPTSRIHGTTTQKTSDYIFCCPV